MRNIINVVLALLTVFLHIGSTILLENQFALLLKRAKEEMLSFQNLRIFNPVEDKIVWSPVNLLEILTN